MISLDALTKQVAELITSIPVSIREDILLLKIEKFPYHVSWHLTVDGKKEISSNTITGYSWNEVAIKLSEGEYLQRMYENHTDNYQQYIARKYGTNY